MSKSHKSLYSVDRVGEISEEFREFYMIKIVITIMYEMTHGIIMSMFIGSIAEFFCIFKRNTIGIKNMIECDFFCWKIYNWSICIDSSDDIFN